MISLEIRLVFVVMGFDLLLMLIINLTVFLVISGFPFLFSYDRNAAVDRTKKERKEQKRKGKNVLSKKL
jgi:arginine exporter protein ArgO